MKLLYKWMVCVITLLAVSELFPKLVTVREGVLTIVIAASLLWLVNIIVRPFAQIISFPLTLITFGIFSIIVNALMVSLVELMMPQFRTGSFWINLLIALVISIANTFISVKNVNKNKD